MLQVLVSDSEMLYCVYSVMTRLLGGTSVGSQPVPSMHLAPVLGLDYDVEQSEDDKQVGVSRDSE